jgi:hypothetical protein
MTITANPWIFAILLFGIGCFGLWMLWLMRRPPVVLPDRTELDNAEPLVRVPPKAKEPPVFINTIGKE